MVDATLHLNNSLLNEPPLRCDSKRARQRGEAAPFIKWAGGKRRLLSYLAPFFPPLPQVRRYFEPFLGGGAVFFYLQHPRSFLSDSNRELIELYLIVRDRVEELIASLGKYRNKREDYYRVRAQAPAALSPVERAARFIFLNKTCYNGLYRVNSKGQFNVPFGKYKNPLICDAEGLRAASRALREAHIFAADFREAVSAAGEGDFIYFDPPYHPRSKTSNFTSYTSGKFGDEEQRCLADLCRDLVSRGCYVMLSNSDTPLIRELYADFLIVQVQAPRAINSKGNRRGKIPELLVLNDPLRM